MIVFIASVDFKKYFYFVLWYKHMFLPFQQETCVFDIKESRYALKVPQKMFCKTADQPI